MLCSFNAKGPAQEAEPCTHLLFAALRKRKSQKVPSGTPGFKASKSQLMMPEQREKKDDRKRNSD
jgi:hypothetical protein